ncbi:C-C motif chemokine 4-like [Acipenser ruthenus]|uniref:C-C motif chemokine 4-like n=1 Tax=Acipenser ruthenus TaxID=7906 RepID=UPI002740F627|nr:C-C motif chemokine 4-like [Acipenser ruthenus]
MHHFNMTFQLALIVIICGLAIATNGAGKPIPCCQQTSRQPIKGRITGYIFQEEALPCVKAVIFYSNGKIICSNPKMPWVKIKIEQFESSQ